MILFFAFDAYAQSTFERTYSGNADCSGVDIFQTFDGNLMIVAVENELNRSDHNLFLLKVNPNGDTLWTKKYNINLGTITRGIQTSDSCFIFTGKSGNNLFLFKLDHSGDSLWFKTFDPGSNYSLGYSLIEASDGTLIVVGEYFFGNFACCNPLIIRTDAYGNFLHHIILSSNNGRAYEIVETSDHNFVISNSVINGPPVPFLTKVTKTGSVIWNKEYTSYCECNVSLSNDEGFLISGKNPTTLKPYLIKTDSEGEVVWNKSYSSFSLLNENLKVAQGDDNGYLMVGGTFNQSSDLNMLKISFSGDSLWQRFYGGNGDDFGNTVIATDDSGFAAVGYATEIEGEPKKVFLVKTDSLGLITFSRTFDLVKNQISINPNPFSNSVLITSTKPLNGVVSIYDISGVIVFSESFFGTEKKLDLNLPKGFYLIHIESNQEIWNGKIIKM